MMSIHPPSEIREVTGITPSQKSSIRAFMQGAVYCWVKNRKDTSFAVRDLMGGENSSWVDTPLQVLYEKHIASGKNDDGAVDSAGQDLGWLVKSVLHDDNRAFEVSTDGMVNTYTWVANRP
jgi:hypothetical protein